MNGFFKKYQKYNCMNTIWNFKILKQTSAKYFQIEQEKLSDYSFITYIAKLQTTFCCVLWQNSASKIKISLDFELCASCHQNKWFDSFLPNPRVYKPIRSENSVSKLHWITMLMHWTSSFLHRCLQKTALLSAN